MLHLAEGRQSGSDEVMANKRKSRKQKEGRGAKGVAGSLTEEEVE